MALLEKMRLLRPAAATFLGSVGFNLFGRKRPLALIYYITYRCQSRCRYCTYWREAAGELSTEEAFRLIDEARAASTQRLGLVGGEPLLRDDIGEVIAYAKDKGLVVTVCTNGYSIPEKIEELKPLDIIIVSLDGPKEIHESQRGKGTFDLALGGIEAAAGAGITTWICCVLTREDIETVDYVIEVAKRMGVECGFQPVAEYAGSPADLTGLMPEASGVRKVLKRLIRYKQEGAPIYESLPYLEHLYRFWPETGTKNLRCYAGRLFCAIDPEGYLFPCQPAVPAGRQGGDVRGAPNFLKVGLLEAFGRLKTPDCQSCFCDSFIESNLLFRLRPTALWNAGAKVFLSL